MSNKSTVTVLVESAVEQVKCVGKPRVATVRRVVCREELPIGSGRCASAYARLVTGTEGKRDTGRRQMQGVEDSSSRCISSAVERVLICCE